jgi:uncharacterized membrane protein YGL010W
MSDTENWLTNYNNNHCRTGILVLHWCGVPLVIFGTVSILWSLPIPEAFRDISPLLNWGITFLMAAEVYYFIISVSLAIGMLPLLFGTAMLVATFHLNVDSPVSLSIAILSVGTAGVYLGKGSERSVCELARDLQLIMIAPIWLLSRLYRRLRIPF